MKNKSEALKETINRLPDNPGVYRYYNAEGELIYVGKAKNLKKRVSSYFTNKSSLDRKTLRLVSLIANIEFSIVDSEYDALLLENSLIKTNQPRYNINLKDDKSYPYVVVTSEPYPRIFPTRQLNSIKGNYFGPYASVKMMNTLLELIKKLFHIRTCSLPMTLQNVRDGKWKVCLEYHLGNCKGPCEDRQSLEEYRLMVDAAVQILKGNLSKPKQLFKEQMNELAMNLEFEKAQLMKMKLELLENYQAKSLIVNPLLSNIDVFAINSTEEAAYVHYMSILYGSIVNVYNLEIKKKLEETDAELITAAIINIRELFNSKSEEILVNIPVDDCLPNVKFVVPQIGDKRKLVELALKNALFYRKEKTEEKTPKQKPSLRVLIELKNDLRLKELPDHIECFDNSNIQGTNPVAAMVCFKNGLPAKKDYRHFIIKTVEGPNDFASMKEIISRRYSRLLAESAPLPKLIIVDGGKGQLSSAVEALKELNLYGKIPILGIAKRLEELYFPEDPLPLSLNKKSESLRLIQRMRDEAHRFGITHHRKRRSKSALYISLEQLPGFGSATVEKLLKNYRTFAKILEVPIEEVGKLIGLKKAEQLVAYLKEQKAINEQILLGTPLSSSNEDAELEDNEGLD